jgi:1,4-alpha-glucan branching enzyme
MFEASIFCRMSGFMEDSYLPSSATVAAETTTTTNHLLSSRRTVTLTWSDRTSKNVKIGGSFNDWQPVAMERDMSAADGGWVYSMDLTAGTYQYKFYVEEAWQLDPAGGQPVEEDSGGNANHVLRVTADPRES